MTLDTRHDDAGRGRDLALMTLEIVASDGSMRMLSSVLCPKEQRARPLDECLPCLNSGGPVRDPTATPGFLECRGVEPVSHATTRDPGDAEPSVADRTPVWKVMTRGVVAIRADLSLARARALLLERGIGGAPVVDDDGRPIGMLSVSAIVRAGSDALSPSARVSDLMERRASTLAEGASVSEAAALLAFEGLQRAAVVSRDGRVVGVVTPLDLIRWLVGQDGLLLPAGRSLQAR